MKVFKLDKVAYKYADARKFTFENISYEFEKGKVYAIVGHSGSGKTTLLSLMAGLDEVTKGKVVFKDEDIKKINKDEYRSKNIGVIFQSFNLLPALTAKENIALSMDIAGYKTENKDEYIKKLLSTVNIGEDKLDKRVLKLSGGEQQRIAIARALSYNPEVILADEPTGNLDRKNEKEVINIFKKMASKDKCVIIVTHSEEVAKEVDFVYDLEKEKTKNKK